MAITYWSGSLFMDKFNLSVVTSLCTLIVCKIYNIQFKPFKENQLTHDYQAFFTQAEVNFRVP